MSRSRTHAARTAASPRRAANQAASRWTWAGVDSAAGRCLRASRASATRPVATAQSSRARQAGTSSGRRSQAGVEPSRRLVELALPDRQVGPPQPDPIVLGSEPLGAIQEGADRLGGGSPHTQRDAEPDQRNGLLGAAAARAIQALPVGLDQPPRLLDPPFMPVERRQNRRRSSPSIRGSRKAWLRSRSASANRPRSDQHHGPAQVAGTANGEWAGIRAQAAAAASVRPRAFSQRPRR